MIVRIAQLYCEWHVFMRYKQKVSKALSFKPRFVSTQEEVVQLPRLPLHVGEKSVALESLVLEIRDVIDTS